MSSIEARAMKTEYKQLSVTQIPLDGLRISGVELRQLGVSLQDQQELRIPKGTALQIPQSIYQPVGFTDGCIDDGTLVALLGISTAVVFPADSEMKVGHEDGETLVSVDGPALTHLLNTYARLRGGALAFVSEPGAISVEGMKRSEDKLVVDSIRFMDTQVRE